MTIQRLEELNIEQVINADFRVDGRSPVIKPFGGALAAADPSLLTPDLTPDGKWRLFCHTQFGVYQLASDDGVKFGKPVKVASRGMRPDINLVDGKYYLFYERTRPLVMNALTLVNLAKWRSEIAVKTSDDLVNWSEARTVISYSQEIEKCDRGVSISNPFLLNENGRFRLYCSCGLTFIKDCGFCEPTYITYAESDYPASGYVKTEKPVLSPDRGSEYLNLCCGCLKVYRLRDGYIGIQNGIYEKDGHSHSAILLLTSPDGKDFRFEKVLLEPGGAQWMNQFVYSSHLVLWNNELRLYFNARNTADMIRGRECIGFASAQL